MSTNPDMRKYRVLASNQMERPGKWWCSSCSILYEMEKNPITCTSCGDDVTIAPQRALK